MLDSFEMKARIAMDSNDPFVRDLGEIIVELMRRLESVKLDNERESSMDGD